MASAKPSVRSRAHAPPSRAPPPPSARSTYDAYRDEQDRANERRGAGPKSSVDPHKGQSLGEKVCLSRPCCARCPRQKPGFVAWQTLSIAESLGCM